VTLQLIQELIGDRQSGYVFLRETWTRTRQNQPLSIHDIWHVAHDTAEAAGVQNFCPRILRQYFAANWALREKKSLVVLQAIMRHRSLAVTSIYIAHLTFWEDLQKEYEIIQNGPFEEFESAAPAAMPKETVNLKDSICGVCSNLELCKFQPLPPCVTACKYKEVKKIGVAAYY
jgi:hypothetical protein